jgi:hypothetical protein
MVVFALRFEDREWCGCSVDLIVGSEVPVAVVTIGKIVSVMGDL